MVKSTISLKNTAMHVLLIKSASKYKNMPGYYLHNGHWHAISSTVAIPKGSPIAAHPHAAGAPVPVKHFTDEEWGKLHLPDSNVNAATHNKQVQKLKEHSEAGDVTAILGSSYGSNNYAKKIVITANHLLKLHGSPHTVAAGQKAGEHSAVSGEPTLSKDEAIDAAIEHLSQDSKQADLPTAEQKEDKALVDKLKAAKAAAPIKLKQGTIALKTPISATKSDFGDYKLNDAEGLPKGAYLAAKDLTIKDGMVVGINPAIATKLGLETVGLVQPKTKLTQKKEAEKAEAEAKEKASVDKQAKLIGGALGLASAVSSGKITAADANKKMKDIKAGYNEPTPQNGDTKAGADGGVLTFKDGHWHKKDTEMSLDEKLKLTPEGQLSSPVLGNTDPYVYHNTSANLKKLAVGLKASKTGMEGPGVYFAITPEKTLAYTDSHGTVMLRVSKSYLAKEYGLYHYKNNPSGKVEFGDDVLVGGKTTVIPPEAIEYQLNGKWLPLKPVPVTPTPQAASIGKLSLIPWDKQLLPDTNSNAATHNKAVAKIKAMADAGDVAGLKAFVDGKANAKQTYAKKQGLLAATALAALTEGDVPPPVAAPVKPVLNDKMTKLADTVSKVIDSSKSPTLPPIPKFSDYNYEIVAKKWQSFAGDGHGAELGTSINKFVETIKKTPSMGDNPDVQSLVLYALALTKWNKANPVTATTPTPKSDNEPQWETFHNTSDGHNKFWSVAVVGNKVHKNYGAIGTKGQTLVAEYPTHEAALKAANKDKTAKLNKGYEEVSSAVPIVDTSPKEGDTKQGADGMLVFKNGRWHKQGGDSSDDDPILMSFVHSLANHKPPSYSDALHVKGKYLDMDDQEGLIDAISLLVPEDFEIGGVSMDYDPQGVLDQFTNVLHSVLAAGPDDETSSVKTESMDDWIQVGNQLGSNNGGKFEDENGQLWYCKFPASEEVARSELLASKLYELAGVTGQDAKLIIRNGKIGIASRWVEVSSTTPSKLKKVDGVLSGFAVDAWLANWDVVGVGYDNLQVGADGKAVRVDAGGSLNYRAQGAKKQFGDSVIEIDSMRDKDVNPQAAAVFGSMSVADITASVSRVVALKDEDIKSLVDSYAGGSSASKAELYNTLIARKADLLAKYPKAAKKPKKKLDPSKLPVKESDLPITHDFSNWNGEGEGLSSHDVINKANEQVEQQIKAIALSGNLLALQDFRFNKIDKGTGKPTGETDVMINHPSKHAIQFYMDTLSALEEIANPPTPLEITKMTGVGSLKKIMAAFPPKKFGTTINHVGASEKLGFWVALGGISGDVSKLRPPVNLPYSESAIKAGHQKYEQGTKLAKHFIHKVQKSKAYNELFRLGHKVDFSGNSLATVAKAALDHSTTQPAGTTLYRWQEMTNDMVQKVLSAPDGTVIQATGPMCTSYHPTATKGFGLHRVVIRYAEGARGVDTFGSGGYESEMEVTTLPNNRFVVLSKKMVPNTEHIGGSGMRLELELLMLPPDLGL